MSYDGTVIYDAEDVTLDDGTAAKRLRVTIIDLNERIDQQTKLIAVLCRQLALVTGEDIDPNQALEEVLLS